MFRSPTTLRDAFGLRRTLIILLALVAIWAPAAWAEEPAEAAAEAAPAATVVEQEPAPGQEEPEAEVVEGSGDLESWWFGQAPNCNPYRYSCEEARKGYYTWLQNLSGDGQECWNGTKLLCVNVPQHPRYCRLFWVGTAPTCSATKEDCARRGADFIAYGTSGTGHRCWSGKKVLCAVRCPENEGGVIEP